MRQGPKVNKLHALRRRTWNRLLAAKTTIDSIIAGNVRIKHSSVSMQSGFFSYSSFHVKIASIQLFELRKFQFYYVKYCGKNKKFWVVCISAHYSNRCISVVAFQLKMSMLFTQNISIGILNVERHDVYIQHWELHWKEKKIGFLHLQNYNQSLKAQKHICCVKTAMKNEMCSREKKGEAEKALKIRILLEFPVRTRFE